MPKAFHLHQLVRLIAPIFCGLEHVNRLLKFKRVSLGIALIVLAGCSGKEHPQMTIHAINPTGDAWYRPPQPIWRFAITNTGDCFVVWNSSVEVKGGEDRDYSNAGGHVEWPQGVLAPGQSVFTNMIVPGKTGSVWRAYIEFWPITQKRLKSAQADAEKFKQPVAGFCPRQEGRQGTNTDEWHQ